MSKNTIPWSGISSRILGTRTVWHWDTDGWGIWSIFITLDFYEINGFVFFFGFCCVLPLSLNSVFIFVNRFGSAKNNHEKAEFFSEMQRLAEEKSGEGLAGSTVERLKLILGSLEVSLQLCYSLLFAVELWNFLSSLNWKVSRFYF